MRGLASLHFAEVQVRCSSLFKVDTQLAQELRNQSAT